MKYLLSVVIPTKNRQEYAYQCVQQILDATNEEVEIVVHDNSDNDNLKNTLFKLSSERIVYKYEKETLSFVDNFEQSIKYANGEFVILIGDDDGILSQITNICRWAKEHDIDAITSDIICTYYWPHSGAVNLKCSEESGYIRIKNYSSKANEINSKLILEHVIKNGCQFYYSSGLAKIYHGIVKKDLLNRIIEKHGRLFDGLSPDIYSSFIISYYAKKIVSVDFPFSIDGNCKKSGAGAQAQGKHTGKLENAPHFIGHENYHWSERVPYVYSIQSIWADSALKALEKIQDSYLLSKFKTEMVSAYIIFNNKSIRSYTLKKYLAICPNNQLISIFKLMFASLRGPIPNLIKRAYTRIKGFGQVGYIINNVPNISSAYNEISKFIKENENEHI